MLKLRVIDNKTQHFILSGNEPFRVEVSVNRGKVTAHVYRGFDIDQEQELDGCYDGHIGLQNISWEVSDASHTRHTRGPHSQVKEMTRCKAGHR